MSGADAAADLPDAVTRRAAGLAAEALRGMVPKQVPPQLRFAIKLRGRTPSSRLIDAVWAALQGDEAFREQVGASVGQSEPLAQAVLDGDDPVADDPAGAAALLFLLRPQGWQERLGAAVEAIPVAVPPSDSDAVQRELEALRDKLRRSEQRREQEAERARQAELQTRAQLSEEIGRLRDQAKRAKAAAEGSVAEIQRLTDQVADLELQARRLRGQVEKLTRAAESDRTALRGARAASTARAKVLLEVLAEAVAGVQEELVFPAGIPRPADLVEAREPAAAVVSRRLTGAAELQEALTLPRCHLIVDGYNVTKGAWPALSLQQQRDRLIASLSGLQARTGAEVTVVFDGAGVAGVPAVSAKGVRVRFSEPDEPADKVVVRLARNEPPGRPVVVVSSDSWLSEGARSSGARTADREVLTALLRH